jgi:hypothetical protein
MATDLAAISRSMESFYGFAGKSVIHVGVGGDGALTGYAVTARSVLGVDPDPEGIARLERSIQERALEERFTVFKGEIAAVKQRADLTLFEFCLHEIEDPAGALDHACALSPEVLVIDHLPRSRWSWYACETEKLERSWAAVRAMTVLRESAYEAVQLFRAYRELESRLEVLGEPALERIRELSGRTDISIEMPYGMALLEGRRS